jgi:hypothetical protein
MQRRLSASMCVALIVLVACGDGAPAGDGSSPSPQRSPSPSPTILGACEPEEPTTTSSGWQRHESPSGTYGFAFPAEWQDLTGQVTYVANEIVTEETLSEAGISADTQVDATLVRDPAGVTNLTVFEFEGVESSTDVVYQRQEARIQALPAVQQVLGTGITACVGGETALGLDFSFTGPREDTGEEATFYQRTFQVVRDGALYVIQILAIDPGAASILDEVIRTWEWAPAATSPPSGEAFAEAAATADVDPDAAAPDPATFASTFPSDTPTIYVVFRLQSGVGGDVQIEWKTGGEVVATGGTQTLPDDGTWAFNALNAPPLGFPAGDYEVELTFLATGEVRTVAFTVTESS